VYNVYEIGIQERRRTIEGIDNSALPVEALVRLGTRNQDCRQRIDEDGETVSKWTCRKEEAMYDWQRKV